MKKKILVLMLGFLLIAVNLYAAGDLIVNGRIGAGGSINPGTTFNVKDVDWPGPAISMQNDEIGVWIFYFVQGQTDHLSTIPAGRFDYYLFEDSNSGRNKAFQIYGYPTEASGVNYGSLQVIGANNDFEIKTGNTAADIILTPGTLSGNVGIGTTLPAEKLDVEGNVEAWGFITGDITFQKDGKKLWRMFEDEEGLYIESVKTGKVYRFVLQEVEKK